MLIIALINYGAGNLCSASRAIDRVAREQDVSCDIKITDDPEIIRRADLLILPGVGAFASCYDKLVAVSGMIEALEESVLRRGRPFFGICVGMQLMAEYGHEFTTHVGLGWIPGHVFKISSKDPQLKVPHMGWNELHQINDTHPILRNLPSEPHAYFVHSYHFMCTDSQHCLAVTDYGDDICAIISRDNLIGTQFHPEKSQSVGLTILANFLCWRP